MRHGISHIVEYPFTDLGPGYLPPSPLPFPISFPIPPDIGPGHISPLLLASGGPHWRHVQTCSLEDLLPPSTGTDT